MAWFRVHYTHVECNAAWEDEWSCACNDRCPVCNKEIEPDDYVDLTAIIEFDKDAREWVVSLSPPEAENSPCYRTTRFKEESRAREFVSSTYD